MKPRTPYPRLAVVVLAATVGLLLGPGCRKGGGSGSSGKDEGGTRAADFTGAGPWLNTDKPISLADLKGRVVVLNFWTSSSVDCMEVLPDLRQLQEKYKGQPVVVIGVHSGKFDEEKDADHVRQAVLRLRIADPVVVDSDHKIWQAYHVSSWPTEVVVDPEGRIERTYVGTDHRSEMDEVVKTVLETGRKKGTLAPPLTFPPAGPESKPGADPSATDVLAFPGKVLADGANRRLFISDTNHDRILLGDLEGNVSGTVGGGEAGLKDGDFAAARFRQPQGLALAEDGQTLYVADTGNHALRAVDLKARSVTTLAGDGRPSRRFRPESDGKAADGNAAELCFPWDLARVNRTLYVAMAGTHQVWAYDLDTRKVSLYAGAGTEGCRDGPAAQAYFSQPSGLVTDGGRAGNGAGGSSPAHFLYVADAQVSSIRAVAFGSEPSLKTIAGSGDLFGFGLQNRSAQQARFQYPLGVALVRTSNRAAGDRGVAADTADTLFVADTYNNVIRSIDLGSYAVTTLAGTGRRDAGEESALNTIGFYEPGGISATDQTLYVADTNHHRVVALDLNTRKPRVLGVRIAPHRP